LTLFSFTYKVAKNLNKVPQIIYFLTAVLIFLIIFSPFILQDIYLRPKNGFDILYGDLFYFLFLPYVLLLVSITTFNFFSSYRYLKREEKLRLQYLLIGLGIFVIGSAIFSFLFPIITGSDIYYRLGNYSSIFFVALTAYAIIRKHLFGIKIILTELLVGVMGIILLIQIFLAPTLNWRISSTVVFLLFCVFGYYLIKYIRKEEELRKQAEDLAEGLKQLNEAKSVFINTAAHDLRTPLTELSWGLSGIERGIYGDFQKEYPEKAQDIIVKLQKSTKRLNEIVESLLSVARIQQQTLSYKKEPVNLQDLIKEVVDSLDLSLERKNLKIILNLC